MMWMEIQTLEIQTLTQGYPNNSPGWSKLGQGGRNQDKVGDHEGFNV